MKKRIFSFIIFFLIPFLIVAQCDNSLIELCLLENGGATYLKEFPVKLKKGKRKDPTPFARFTLALKKGSHYRLNVKNDSLNNSFAILQLSDDYRIYGSTFDRNRNKNYNHFDFYCKNTGTYYITLLFNGKEQGCAVGMLSLVDIFPVY